MSNLARFARLGQRMLSQKHAPIVQPVRKMGGQFVYREGQKNPENTPKWHYQLSALIMFVAVTWSGLMTYNHFGHIVGEFPEIKPETWTDEELGIPPDEEDIYPPGYVPQGPRPPHPKRKNLVIYH